ncbi:hypothetical protein [Nocardia colli]|uniref:hypothetical protein n=1 Tax=Nocardia colli TaxID=2545717 RepID=UPI0035E330EE
MSIKKLTLTALLAVCATGIAAGGAHAQPNWFGQNNFQSTPDYGVRGADRDVSYATSLNPDQGSITTTLDAGRFELTGDGKAVAIFDQAGAEVASLPMAVQFAGGKYLLAPNIEQVGRSLTLTLVGAPALNGAQTVDAQRHFVDAAADLNRHQYNAGVGALIGLGIGILLGLPLLIVGAIPGGVLGAAIGALIGWVLP